jgi:hypothetical protein
MAWTAILLIAVAFGGMALAFGRCERSEERRILARAEAVLARGSIAVDLPAPDEEGEPLAAAAGASPPDRRAPVAARPRSAA